MRSRRDDARLTRFLDSPPQTNEVSRSAALLPGYLEIARLDRLAAVDPRNRRERGTESLLRPLFLRLWRVRAGAIARGASRDRLRMARRAAGFWRRPSSRRSAGLRPQSDRRARSGRPRADARLYLARPGGAARARRGGVGPRRLSEGLGSRRSTPRSSPRANCSAARRDARWCSRTASSGSICTDATKGGHPRRDRRGGRARHERARSPGCAWRRRPTSGAARCCACRSGREGRSTRCSRVADFHGRWLEWRGVV